MNKISSGILIIASLLYGSFFFSAEPQKKVRIDTVEAIIGNFETTHKMLQENILHALGAKKIAVNQYEIKLLNTSFIMSSSWLPYNQQHILLHAIPSDLRIYAKQLTASIFNLPVPSNIAIQLTKIDTIDTQNELLIVASFKTTPDWALYTVAHALIEATGIPQTIATPAPKDILEPNAFPLQHIMLFKIITTKEQYPLMAKIAAEVNAKLKSLPIPSSPFIITRIERTFYGEPEADILWQTGKAYTPPAGGATINPYEHLAAYKDVPGYGKLGMALLGMKKELEALPGMVYQRPEWAVQPLRVTPKVEVKPVAAPQKIPVHTAEPTKKPVDPEAKQAKEHFKTLVEILNEVEQNVERLKQLSIKKGDTFKEIVNTLNLLEQHMREEYLIEQQKTLLLRRIKNLRDYANLYSK